MLSSIHPFGERSRDNNFSVTATAHVVGSTMGGIGLGALMGAIAWLTAIVWPVDSFGRPLALGVAAAMALVIESTGRTRRLPTRIHQVNENWIQTYRGWVYGAGFGIELGFGLSTIITTSLVHLMVLAMVLTGSATASMLLGGIFGCVRGASILVAARADSPERLRSLHRRLDHYRRPSDRAAIGALGVAGAVAMAAVIL